MDWAKYHALYLESTARNLLTDTLDELAAHGKQPGDVRWVGVSSSPGDPSWCVSWDTFVGVARTFTYPHDRGGCYVNYHLVVVGDGWWLERFEYDGAEGWEYKRTPINPDQSPATLTKKMLRDE